MAEWSQSQLLQSLGWATLNSFWQMGLLWCVYLICCNLTKPSAAFRYQLSVGAILTGFAWFILTFALYYSDRTAGTLAILDHSLSPAHPVLGIVLTSASIAYLALLAFPSYRLYQNWQFVRRIRKEGLRKADIAYRLFADKVAPMIGIRKKVLVYTSTLVQSPLTVGYLKPIILLPIAALNHLSSQQVEAILLHELSHIRRSDYLVNLLVSVIHTVLYFNPFVKMFIRNIENERETCCDDLVLQFGYDKVGYASALLTLEKVNSGAHQLALGAAGKTPLFNRIEKIVGMEKKKAFGFYHFAGLLAALICIVAFNSILIIKEQKEASPNSFSFTHFINPLYALNPEPEADGSSLPEAEQIAHPVGTLAASLKETDNSQRPDLTIQYPDALPTEESPYVFVSADEADAKLTMEQKAQVKKTVEGAKKVLNGQWSEVEKAIGEAMTEEEKVLAREEYLNEIESVNWQNLEQSLKANFEKVDWNKLNTTIKQELTQIKLDSMQKSYSLILQELEQTNRELAAAQKLSELPIPDVSVRQLNKAKEEVRARIDSIYRLKNKKIIKL